MESVWDLKLEHIRDTTASEHPFATSGAIAIITAVYASSLLRMTLKLSSKKFKTKAKSLAAVALLEQLESASSMLSKLADKDIAAFQGFLAAFRMSKDNERNKRVRLATIRARRIEATRIPLQACDEIMKVVALIDQLIPLCLPGLLCDLAIAANILHSSVLNLCWSISENSKQLPSDKKQLLASAVIKLTNRSKAASRKVNNRIRGIVNA